MQRFVLVTATAALLAGCAATNSTFIGDASATCGSPTMLMPDSRDYVETTTIERTNRIYDCVQNYLARSPEYQGSMQGKSNDARYVEAMRQIDLARASGQLTPDQAKDKGLATYNSYKGSY